ncbi:DUF2860 domain-containing protein [Campylobacter jejuni]|nr:DUF2860 domain-containing protein [Campylobacter jejuni]EAI5268806.1 DUF2860 domain-containing protein [Campylobacter jejuni]EAI5291112.1 DUF2860 domain-containing protein [Campylobacter jejuni]EAI6249378.1 DUF2860 domain-containing protein [Campylobacter jejuni]EAI6313138.1 DUF2860 domain-containing protein [Campylobacter jejuni]
MKKYLFSCVLASILTQSATAVEFQEGFSGNLSIGVGARDIKSNISTLANSDYLSSRNADNSDSSFIPFIGAELYYGNLIDNDRIFIKNYNGRDISGIALGYERAYLERFSTSFSVISSLREKAYANPYAIGNREETDVDRYGFKISQLYESDFGKFTTSYLFSKNKYDKDTIAQSSLKREGYYHEFELNYNYSLLNLGLNYNYNDADGKAQSYSRYGFSIGTNLAFANDYIFTPNLNLSKYEAVGTDPIFHKKQDGNIVKLNLKVVKNQFLGYNGLYGFANYGIEKRNSDIGFYDETYQIVLTGIGYKF